VDRYWSWWVYWKRFELAKKYKKEYEYAPFLLQEEMFGPIALSYHGRTINTHGKLEGMQHSLCRSKLLKNMDHWKQGQSMGSKWWNGWKAERPIHLLREWGKILYHKSFTGHGMNIYIVLARKLRWLAYIIEK